MATDNFLEADSISPSSNDMRCARRTVRKKYNNNEIDTSTTTTKS